MMKRSFAEIDSAQDESERLRRVEELVDKLDKLEKIECEYCAESITQYYLTCEKITHSRRKLQVSHVMWEHFFSRSSFLMVINAVYSILSVMIQ